LEKRGGRKKKEERGGREEKEERRRRGLTAGGAEITERRRGGFVVRPFDKLPMPIRFDHTPPNPSFPQKACPVLRHGNVTPYPHTEPAPCPDTERESSTQNLAPGTPFA